MPFEFPDEPIQLSEEVKARIRRMQGYQNLFKNFAELGQQISGSFATAAEETAKLAGALERQPTEEDLCDACNEGFLLSWKKGAQPIDYKTHYDQEHGVFYHLECWQSLGTNSTRTSDKPTIRKRDGTIL